MTKITRIILIALVIMAVSQLAFAFESTVSLRGGLTMSKSDFDGTDDTTAISAFPMKPGSRTI